MPTLELYKIHTPAQLEHYFRQFPEWAKQGANHHHRNVEDTSQILIDACGDKVVSEKMKETCITGILDQIVAIAAVNPRLIQALTHQLSQFAARDHNYHIKLKAILVKKGLAVLPALAQTDANAACYLAKMVIESCSNDSCLNKTIPVILAVCPVIGTTRPYAVAEMMQKLEEKINAVKGAGHCVTKQIKNLVKKGFKVFSSMDDNNARHFLRQALADICSKYKLLDISFLAPAHAEFSKTPTRYDRNEVSRRFVNSASFH